MDIYINAYAGLFSALGIFITAVVSAVNLWQSRRNSVKADRNFVATHQTLAITQQTAANINGKMDEIKKLYKESGDARVAVAVAEGETKAAIARGENGGPSNAS